MKNLYPLSIHRYVRIGVILPFSAISLAPFRVSRAKERESASSESRKEEGALFSLMFSITVFTPLSDIEAKGEERKEANDSISSSPYTIICITQ